jgi:hypothetical protein
MGFWIPNLLLFPSQCDHEIVNSLIEGNDSRSRDWECFHLIDEVTRVFIPFKQVSKEQSLIEIEPEFNWILLKVYPFHIEKYCEKLSIDKRRVWSLRHIYDFFINKSQKINLTTVLKRNHYPNSKLI